MKLEAGLNAATAARATPSPSATRGRVVDFVLLAAIWGSSFLFMRLGAVEFGALPTAAVRVAIAAAFLLPLLWLRGLGPQLRRNWKPIFAIGVLNSPGLIDSGYRGEVRVILHNHGAETFRVDPGMRIAQLVVVAVESARLVEVDELPGTERGEGGHGSSGV